MDAKYNNFIDSLPWRVALNLTGFSLWLALAYGLMQAAGEYLDHVRTARSWETRLNRTLIRPEPLKHRALSLIRELAISAV